MQKIQHSPKFLKRRKLLLVLPPLVLPFVFFGFHVLGGGKGKPKNEENVSSGQGYNSSLPGARFAKKENAMDKLAFYKKADEDSINLMERIRQDPYHVQSISSRPLGISAEDGRADELLKKLGQLKNTIREPSMAPGNVEVPRMPEMAKPGIGLDESKLEKLMQAVKRVDTMGGDPQIEKLNRMLDKILRIQHPGLNQDTGNAVPALVEKAGVREMTIKKEKEGLTDLPEGLTGTDQVMIASSEAFYTIGDDEEADTVRSNLITAVVEEAQTVVAGSTLLLRLTEDALINGVTIPSDNPVCGKVYWQNDRLMVTISSIRCKNTEFKVSLKVFDMDGLEGLEIPGSINRDVGKESLDQGIGSLGVMSLDPSAGAQVTGAGIQAAKTLLSRKAKLVRGYVPAGYEVFLQSIKTSSN